MKFRVLPCISGVLLFCASCTSYYSIQIPPGGFKAPRAPKLKTTLRLENFRASPPLDETAFELYDSTSRTIYRKTHYQWHRAPIDLINEMLLQSLTTAEQFSDYVKVVPEGTPAEFAISGEVTKMKIVAADDDPHRVYVSIHIRVARTAIADISGAPVFERNYIAGHDVTDACLAQVPAAFEQAMDSIIDSLLADLSDSLASPPRHSSLLVVNAEKCRERCAFRFTPCDAGARLPASAPCLGVDILDVDGDVRAHIGLFGITRINDRYYTARTTGNDTGLTVTIAIITRKERSYLRIEGLLGGPVEIAPANDIAEVERWMSTRATAK